MCVLSQKILKINIQLKLGIFLLRLMDEKVLWNFVFIYNSGKAPICTKLKGLTDTYKGNMDGKDNGIDRNGENFD